NYAYARSPRTLWVNLYGGSTVEATLDGAGRVRMTQETEYPWNGRVRVTMNETEGREFTLKLRIPEWSNEARLRINRRPEALGARPGSYATLTRRWQTGDVLELELPMVTRLIEANPLVEETLNQLAVKRGPLVYCLESADLPEGVRVGEVSLPPDVQLSAQHDRHLLGGVVALSGAAEARKAGDWNGRLYRELKEATATPVTIRLVPYYAWGNRGQGEMTVWMPRAR
ncbi:MAG TPA: glycoside hydrolase family 127 protein, partial [Methylomirabilota bacterium]|nr:glycoside hydrolase family 127 protein [Methylomirabilota bacterium]